MLSTVPLSRSLSRSVHRFVENRFVYFVARVGIGWQRIGDLSDKAILLYWVWNNKPFFRPSIEFRKNISFFESCVLKNDQINKADDIALQNGGAII